MVLLRTETTGFKSDGLVLQRRCSNCIRKRLTYCEKPTIAHACENCAAHKLTCNRSANRGRPPRDSPQTRACFAYAPWDGGDYARSLENSTGDALLTARFYYKRVKSVYRLLQAAGRDEE